MAKSSDRDLFSGSLVKNILLFTLPIIATGILQLLFNTADLAVVGLFRGEEAVAAVGSTSSMIHLIVNLLVGLSVGASVVVAQAYGAGDREAIGQGVHTAFAVALFGGVIFGILGFFMSRPILVWMGTDPAVLDSAVLYVKIYFFGVPMSMVYNFGASILRAVGNTRTPLLYLTLSGILNVVLNCVFVVFLDMSVEGVAIATAVSQAMSAILIVRYFMKSHDACRFEFSRFGIHKNEFIRMLRIGVPAGLQGSLFSISNVLIQSSVNSFASVEVIAGNTAAMTLEGYVYTMMNAFSAAAMTFVGQTVGAKRFDRISRVALRCIALVSTVGLLGGAFCYLLRTPLLGIFLSGEEGDASASLTYGSLRLLFIAVPYFLCGLMDVLTGLLRGMGSSTVPMIITVGGVCGLRLLWIYTVFAAYHELWVLYLSYPISWIVTGLIQFTLFVILERKLVKRWKRSGAALT
ncbi:MAG: MATE family efflux transporter [Clostridia bacterium]|nr:MATE family efflux transporter [Clostridia bacterium]